MQRARKPFEQRPQALPPHNLNEQSFREEQSARVSRRFSQSRGNPPDELMSMNPSGTFINLSEDENNYLPSPDSLAPDLASVIYETESRLSVSRLTKTGQSLDVPPNDMTAQSENPMRKSSEAYRDHRRPKNWTGYWPGDRSSRMSAL